MACLAVEGGSLLFIGLTNSKRAELDGRAFEVNQLVGISRVSSERGAEKSDKAKKSLVVFTELLHRLFNSLLIVRRS